MTYNDDTVNKWITSSIECTTYGNGGSQMTFEKAISKCVTSLLLFIEAIMYK